MDQLLCELHAHTTWSDGMLSVSELVDLYGRHRFDVLCVTDHTHRAADECAHLGVRPERFAEYLAEIECEARRARSEYDLLVIPGLELTDNQPEPDRAAHAVAVGLRAYVSLEDGFPPALDTARGAGAALVAAHPSGPETVDHRATRRFWRELDELRALVDRWELINRFTAFPWVAEARLPVVASGDFHWPEHVSSWKTLLTCERNEEAVVAFLRSSARTAITPFVAQAELAAA